MICLIVIAVAVEMVGPVDVGRERGVAQQEQQGVERGPLVRLRPDLVRLRPDLVRLRPDGAVERFDANEFRFKATGSRFQPAPAGRLPVIRSRQAPRQRQPRAGERFQREIPQFQPVSPRSAAPGLSDA